MNNLLWAEWSNVDDENIENIKLILKSFNDVINGLILLEDNNYIFNSLNSSKCGKNCYFDLYAGLDGGFVGLSEEFEKLRSVLFGGVFDWNEIKKSLG